MKDLHRLLSPTLCLRDRVKHPTLDVPNCELMRGFSICTMQTLLVCHILDFESHKVLIELPHRVLELENYPCFLICQRAAPQSLSSCGVRVVPCHIVALHNIISTCLLYDLSLA